MLIYIVPNSDYNTEQLFNLSKASMLLYDFEEQILTIQYEEMNEYEIEDVSEYEYGLIKENLCSSSGSSVVRHKQN